MSGDVTWSGSYAGSSPAYHPRGIYFSPNSLSGPMHGSGYFSATAANVCGSTVVASRGYGPCSPFGFAMYPNPASSEISILYQGSEDVNQTVLLQEVKSSIPEFDVLLFNNQNIEVLKGKAKEGKLTLDTSALPKGIYVVHIISHGNREILTVKLE